MIDTHAHLDACADPPEALVERARAAGVTRIVTVGTGLESCRTALGLAERHEGVYAALGIHPHQAGGPEAANADELEALLTHPKAVAVGETGLDHYRDYAPHDAQLRLFEAQLALAEALRQARRDPHARRRRRDRPPSSTGSRARSSCTASRRRRCSRSRSSGATTSRSPAT